MFLFVVLFTSAKTYDYMYFENYGILDFFSTTFANFYRYKTTWHNTCVNQVRQFLLVKQKPAR